MRSTLLKPFMFLALSALLVSGLPVVAPHASSGAGMSAEAQTQRRTRRTTRRATVYTNTSIISVGTELRIRLADQLSSEDARVGDRFTATVVGPARYESAIVRGHVGSIKKSGRVKGTTSMNLVFDSIEMPEGRRGAMRAELVRVYDESSAEVDEEGRVESDSRGKQTLKRGGIGAAAGAILGGIVGGGKGAVAGLIIGGAAGAGSIAIEGSKDLTLEPGTEMLIRVTRR